MTRKMSLGRPKVVILGLVKLALCFVVSSAGAQGIADSTLSTKELAAIHCGRCHQPPKTTDISQEYWPYVLASMGQYLGFKAEDVPDYRIAPEGNETSGFQGNRVATKLLDADDQLVDVAAFKAFVLPTPIISKADWNRIRDYYVNGANPLDDMYIRRPKHPVTKAFVPVSPELDIEPNGLVFSAAVDAERGRLYVGRTIESESETESYNLDGLVDELLTFDLKSGEQLDRRTVGSDLIGLEVLDDGAVRAAAHGEYPVDKGNGQGKITDFRDIGSEDSRSQVIADGLHRVTQFNTGDIDGDGLEDFVVNAFGDGYLAEYGGRFSVFWQTSKYAEESRQVRSCAKKSDRDAPNSTFEETVLMERVGLIGSTIADFNNDGRPDLALLNVQAQQQVILFINNGDRTFTRKQSGISEIPSWGGNDVLSADMDGDGHVDLVVINGDNPAENGVDFPGRPRDARPYHGLRIYRNNGDLTFTERFFYPMHGAVRAEIEDFDGDGDHDVAMIALWPEWSFEEPETFVYLENDGELEFQPFSLPRQHFGVWLGMAVGDVNNDQQPDIVLGLANWPFFVPSDWTTRDVMQGRNGEAPTVLFLINATSTE